MRFFAILFFLVFVPMGAFAQIIPSLQSPIEVQTIPQTPEPNSTIIVQAQNVLNKDSLLFIWTVNGEVVEEGIGLDRTTLTTGGAGTRTVVEVTISSGGEVVDSKTRVIVPAEVNLVWEADTYTPPFYPGRPLPTGASIITVSAIPNIVVGGTRQNSNSLVYTWFLNGSLTPHRSGFGLSSIFLRPPLFDSAFSVRVVATTQDRTVVAEDTVSIVPRSPTIALYERHPLLGTLFNRAVRGVVESFDSEITLNLFPLFVVDTETLVYTWIVQGDTIDTGDTPRELTLRKTSDDRGTFSIQTELENSESFYEQATRDVSLTF